MASDLSAQYCRLVLDRYLCLFEILNQFGMQMNEIESF